MPHRKRTRRIRGSIESVPTEGTSPDALRRFLESPERPHQALTFDELPGFLFAVVAAPELTLPSEWMAIVFGGAPIFDDHAQAKEVMSGLMSLYNEINRQVLDRDEGLTLRVTFRDDPASDLEENAPAHRWCRGFVRGFSLLKESWDEVLPKELEAPFACLVLTLGFFGSRTCAERIHARSAVGGESLADYAARVREAFPGTMMAYGHLGQTLIMWDAGFSGPGAGTVGRNDPCPCASGKKYKRCCAAANPSPISESPPS